jgi:hypothetical protein
MNNIDYDKFKKSLKHLQLQFNNYESLDENFPELIQEGIAESVIQRFEICWDCLWKVLRRYLIEEIALPDVPNGPNPVLRLANENNLLPGSIDDWLKYARIRIVTSQDYSEEKIAAALEQMRDFIADAIALYQKLSAESWQ